MKHPSALHGDPSVASLDDDTSALMSTRDFMKAAAALAFGAAPVFKAFAQAEYPSKPIRIIAAYPPGQGIDIIGRALAAKLQPLLGQQVFIENRPGAAGFIGQQAAATAVPDGYTLLITAAGAMAINPALYEKMPYDPVKDYEAVAGITSVPLVLVAHPSVPANNLKELIELARKSPGSVNFASFGSGSTNHLVSELVSTAAGVKMTHIPYKGSAAALTDVIGGRVGIIFDTPPSALSMVKDGRVKALAVTSQKRLPLFPDVPTLAESGYPQVSAATWMIMVAPARTPPEIVAKLNAAITKVVDSAEMRQFFESQGVEAMPMDPQQTGAFVKAELAKWAVVVKASGAKAE